MVTSNIEKYIIKLFCYLFATISGVKISTFIYLSKLMTRFKRLDFSSYVMLTQIKLLEIFHQFLFQW